MSLTIQIQENVMTDEQFFEFCQMNRDVRIERTNNLIIIQSPQNSATGNFNVELGFELGIWNRRAKNGKVFDSSTGFTMPDGSVRSPDLSWILNDKWEAIDVEKRERFAPVCPDFLVEIRSKNDSLKILKKKMLNYIEFGCRLGWLIDRYEQKVYIYRNDGSISIVKSFDEKLSGEDVLVGFELDLRLFK
ncbi:MAG: Uma2 family endonuclease [Saprospiraceae bacterium]